MTPGLSHIIYLRLKQGNIQFQTVSRSNFIFSRSPGGISNLGYTAKAITPVAISTLMKISPDEKEILLKYIYHE